MKKLHSALLNTLLVASMVLVPIFAFTATPISNVQTPKLEQAGIRFGVNYGGPFYRSRGPFFYSPYRYYPYYYSRPYYYYPYRGYGYSYWW